MSKQNILLLVLAGIVILTFSLVVTSQLRPGQYEPALQKQTGIVNPEEPERQPTEEVDTSEWKTYRNEQYDFQFKHPVIKAVNVEFGSAITDTTLANEFYLNGLYFLITEKEGIQSISEFINAKTGSENYVTLKSIHGREVVKVIKDQPTSFAIKDGHRLNTLLFGGVEMAFIDNADYYLWVTSKIGSSGNGELSSMEMAVIESIKFEN